MKPRYKKKAGRSTREKKNDRVMRKESAKVREMPPLDLVDDAVEDNRPRHVVLDNTVPGGFRMEPV